jgi:tetratricopeptide (TPR) repeat protein
MDYCHEEPKSHVSANDDNQDNNGRVIRVDFSTRRRAEEAVLRTPPGDRALERDPVTRTFARSEAAELFDVPLRKLKQWERAGVIVPSTTQGDDALYSFTDLVAVRTARGLLASGFSLKQMQRAIEALRARMPELAQPLTDGHVVQDGSKLVARTEGARFDPISGQLMFDFDVKALRDDVVKVLRPKITRRQQEAYEAYLEGLRLDEEETTRGRAEAAYRKAIALDPGLATALTNLGNLRLLSGDRDEAEALYRQAIASDATQAEAPYNLAYLLVDRGERRAAIELFERAIALRPDFSEAHFNLAMALSELGLRDKARTHWKRYIELDPRGPWSHLARQYLDTPR